MQTALSGLKLRLGLKDSKNRELAGKDAVIAELRASLDRVQKMNDYLMAQK